LISTLAHRQMVSRKRRLDAPRRATRHEGADASITWCAIPKSHWPVGLVSRLTVSATNRAQLAAPTVRRSRHRVFADVIMLLASDEVSTIAICMQVQTCPIVEQP
jgi:hypothetical protein